MKKKSPSFSRNFMLHAVSWEHTSQTLLTTNTDRQTEGQHAVLFLKYSPCRPSFHGNCPMDTLLSFSRGHFDFYFYESGKNILCTLHSTLNIQKKSPLIINIAPFERQLLPPFIIMLNQNVRASILQIKIKTKPMKIFYLGEVFCFYFPSSSDQENLE